MPRIHTVAADGVITAGDKLIGSDGGQDKNFVTRNYTVGGVKDFILGGTHAGSFTTLTTTGNATIGGNVTIAGNITVGDADTDTVSFAADVISNIIPDATNTYNLGSATKEWKDLHLSNSARIADIYLDGSTNQISGVTDIYAQKIYDSNDSTYFLDPSASISLKVKGNIQLGDASAETNAEITSYGDLILKADVDNDGVYERGVEIFRARGGNDGGTAVELNRNQYDLNGQSLPDNIWANIAVGKKIYGLGGGSNYQNVTNATISAIVGWMDGSNTDLGNDLSVVPAGATKLRVTMNTSVSYANSAYLTILDSSATFNEDATRNIKFFSGSSEIASIDKDGKLTVGAIDTGSSAITTTGAFNAGSITTSGNIVATGTIVANNTDTINGININNSNQEMSGIGDIYAYKFYDSQDSNYYIDPGHSGISINVAGQITCAGNASLGGISINASNREVSGVGDLYAYKFFDSQTGSHYLDPGHSSLSLVAAGKLQAGTVVIPNTIGLQGQVLKSTGSDNATLDWADPLTKVVANKTSNNLSALKTEHLHVFNTSGSVTQTLPDSGDGSQIGKTYTFVHRVAPSGSDIHKVVCADTSNEVIIGFLGGNHTHSNFRAESSDNYSAINVGVNDVLEGSVYSLTCIANDLWLITNSSFLTSSLANPFSTT